MEREVQTQQALGQAQALGDLVAATWNPPPRDPDQWAAIEGRLSRPRLGWRLLVPALGAALIFVVGLAALRTLHYQTQGLRVDDDGSLLAERTEGAASFDEGTRISLSPGAQARIHGFAFRRGARLELERGRASLAVVHRRMGRWEVNAGPYAVEVTGTRFQLDWQPHDARLDLSVTEGEVRVSGGPLQPHTAVRAGQRLSVLRDQITLGPLDPPPAPTLAPRAPLAEVPTPVVQTAAPAPVVKRRQARRSPAAPAPVEKPAPMLAPIAPIVAPVPSPAPAAKIPPTPASLIPGATGPLWVDGGAKTVFASRPTPWALDDGMVCTRGTMAALACTNAGTSSIHCDWDTHWGALLGWKTRRDGGAWGSGAVSKVSVDYRGRGTRFRLVAHRRGDPPRKTYCVSDYRSGKVVEASQFKTECWENRGASLSSFAEVDSFAVLVASEESAQTFRICISSVHLF